MEAAIVLASASAAPGPIAEAADRLAGHACETIVVCSADCREAVAAAAETSPRVVASSVPGGGPVASMRAGLRATSAATAFVTTPGTPPLSPDGLAALSPSAGAEASLAVVDGDRRPPCGSYRVAPATAACDTTLAMGSRRLNDVLARLAVETTSVDSPATAADRSAAGGNCPRGSD